MARRGEVFKKYSSPLNTPRAAESILRPGHKAQCYSQRCTNSGVIMMLLVGRGREPGRGVGVIYRCVKHDCSSENKGEASEWLSERCCRSQSLKLFHLYLWKSFFFFFLDVLDNKQSHKELLHNLCAIVNFLKVEFAFENVCIIW